MDTKSVLAELGLSDGEISVYLALLKLGSCPVSKVKEETELHRTTIYDFVEKLLNKGLVNYVIKNNVKYYNATNPNKLQDYLNEKQDRLKQILPALNELAKFQKEEIKVEVYKGKEGLKTVMLDGIRTKKEIVGIGIDEAYWRNNLPTFVEQYQRLLKENNIHERMLTKMNPEYLFDKTNSAYKFLPNNYFSPVSTVIYGDKIQMTIWEPSLTSVIIQNKKLSEAYKNHFESLWNQETIIYKGDEEVKFVFEDIISTLGKGGECITFGVPPTPKKWVSYFDNFCARLNEKGAINKIVIDESAKDLINMSKRHKNVKLKILPNEFMTPAEVDIYGDKAVIILWSKTPQAIMINNKEISQSFKKYFELIWKIAKESK